MVNEMIIAVGLPGCGKTTRYKKVFTKQGFIRVSADYIRQKILKSSITNIYFDKNREKEVWDKYWEDLECALLSDENIYCDNTNLTANQRMKHIQFAHYYHYIATIYYFAVSLEQCLAQNKLREDKGKIIPDKIMDEMYGKFQIPTKAEGADRYVLFRGDQS